MTGGETQTAIHPLIFNLIKPGSGTPGACDDKRIALEEASIAEKLFRQKERFPLITVHRVDRFDDRENEVIKLTIAYTKNNEPTQAHDMEIAVDPSARRNYQSRGFRDV